MKSRTKWLRAAQISAFFLAFCFGFWALWTPLVTTLKVKSIVRKAYSIHQACIAFTGGGDQNFPDGNSANDAFRKLFEKGIVDDERLLWFAPLKSEPSASKPNGVISSSEGNFDKAVEAGECCFYYVRPNRSKGADDIRPLAFTRVGGADGKAYDIVVHVTGNALAQLSEDPTNSVSQMVAKKYGIDPKDILEPEGPQPRAWEIPASIRISPIPPSVLFLAIGIFLHRWRKRLTKSVTATESAA